MKITEVAANNRRRVFEVSARGARYVLPYSRAGLPAPDQDRVADVFVDPELGREAFTYRLDSGIEGSVPMDAVLDYNEEPAYMAELTLYQLTQEARSRFQSSGLSAREVARSLGTSPAQLYRLLEPTNYSKSVRQLIALIYVLGYAVEVHVHERDQTAAM